MSLSNSERRKLLAQRAAIDKLLGENPPPIPGLIAKGGRLYYQFEVHQQVSRGSFDMDDTIRNRILADEQIKAMKKSARSGEYKPQITPLKFDPAVLGYQTFLDATVGKDKKGSTRDRYKSSLVSINLFMADNAPNLFFHQIHKPLIEEYKQWRYDELDVEPSTLRNDLNAWRGFFNWGVDRNHVLANPFIAEQIKMPSTKDSGRQVILYREQGQRYFEAAAAFPDLHDQGKIMDGTGMRPGEVRALAVTAYDSGKSLIKVVDGKSHAARRTLGLVPEVEEIIERRVIHARALGTQWLFPDTDHNEHIGPLNKDHDAVCNQLQLFFRIYDLRHTFATRQAILGMNPFILAYVLGHADTSVLKRYVHPQEDDAARIMREIGEKERLEFDHFLEQSKLLLAA